MRNLIRDWVINAVVWTSFGLNNGSCMKVHLSLLGFESIGAMGRGGALNNMLDRINN